MRKLSLMRAEDNKIFCEVDIPTDIHFISGKPANDKEFERCVNLAQLFIAIGVTSCRYKVSENGNVSVKSTKGTSNNRKSTIGELQIHVSVDAKVSVNSTFVDAEKFLPKDFMPRLLEFIKNDISKPKYNQSGPDPITLKPRNDAIKFAIYMLCSLGQQPTRALNQKGVRYDSCCVQGGSACDAVGLGYTRAYDALKESSPRIFADSGLGGPTVRRKLGYKSIEDKYNPSFHPKSHL